MTPDPFGVAVLRQRVLDTWRTAPARFREDANAESDARTGPVDRLIVELAQNARDAATRAGAPGSMTFRLVDNVLYAANGGAPMDAAGIEALSHLRVSTKDATSVGRFGVGFKAVLTVTDAPEVHTAAGGVQWSRSATAIAAAELAASDPRLADELSRRLGEVPVMRLPGPATADAVTGELLAGGASTVVKLPLRDGRARDDVVAALESVDPLMLLGLPGMAELVIDTGTARTLQREDTARGIRLQDGDVVTDWLTSARSGTLPADLLASRPVEERERPDWSVLWAVPVTAGEAAPYTGDRRLRAPQPTDEVVDVPAVLLATFPLDPTRRHVEPTAVTQWLVARVAETFGDLLAAAAGAASVVDLLPERLPAGPVDLALRDALVPLLPGVAFLPAAGGGGAVRPRDAVLLDIGDAAPALTTILADVVSGLVSADCARGRRATMLADLGARRLDTADVVELLHAVERPAAWWSQVFGAIAAAPDRDALRALPVPLADGRTATGPADLLLPRDHRLPGLAADAGVALRFVHPGCAAGTAGELLALLGARPADAGACLDDPAVRELVESSLDLNDDEAEAVAEFVLALLADDPDTASGREWLSDLALPGADGELWPAGELVLPAELGGRLAPLLVDDAPHGVVASVIVDRWGADAVQAAGVLGTFAVVRRESATNDDDDLDLDDFDGYAAGVLDPVAGDGGLVEIDLVAVRDLEWIRDEAWPQAVLELLGMRIGLLDDARCVVSGRDAGTVPSYVAWWLRQHASVAGADGRWHPIGLLAHPDDDPLWQGLLVEPSPDAARVVAAAGAARPGAGSLLAADAAQLLELLIADHVVIGAAALRARYAAVAAVGEQLEHSGALRAVRSGAAVVVDAGLAVVCDEPDLLPLLGDTPVLPCPLHLVADLAAALGVGSASRLAAFDVTSSPREVLAWEAVPGLSRAAAVLGLDLRHPSLGRGVEVHDPLQCCDVSGAVTRVLWRRRGRVLAVTADHLADGVARAVTATVGQWGARESLAVLLRAGAGAERLEREALLDGA